MEASGGRAGESVSPAWKGILQPRRRTSLVARTKLLVLAGLFAAVSLSNGCQAARGQSPPTVDEIPFSHAIHAGQNGIPCQSCHTFANKSVAAGIPSVQRCMGCHVSVATDKPAIKALAKKFDEGKAPSWTKVYDLPDFVYFSHRMHIRAELACSECHGAVETMDRVQRVSSLQMGWCMDCHEQRGATLDCLACHK